MLDGVVIENPQLCSCARRMAIRLGAEGGAAAITKIGVGGRYSPPRDMFGTAPGLTLPRSTSGDTASQYGARRAPWIPPPPRALSAFPARTLSESPNVCASVTLFCQLDLPEISNLWQSNN